MENDFLNPQKARELVEIYQWFLQNPDKYSYEGLSRKDFLFLVASIGTLFDVENLEQVVKILENIANNKNVIPTHAAIPVNLKDLIEEYEKWESLRREKVLKKASDVQVYQQAEKLSGAISVAKVSQPKIAKLVYQAEKKGGETTQTEKTTKDNLDEWVEQARTIEIVAALVMGGIPIADAKKAAPLIAERLKDAGIKIDEVELEKIIQGILENQQVIISPEQEHAVFENISEKFGVSAQSQTLSSSFKVARPYRPKRNPTSSTSDPLRLSEASETTLGTSKNEKKIKEDYVYLLYKPQSYLQRLGGQFGFLFGGTNNKQVLEAALQRLIIENPQLYTDNSLEMRLLRQGIVNLIATQGKIDNAQFVPQHKIEEALRNYYWSGGSTQSMKLIFGENGIVGKKVNLEKGGESAIKNEVKAQAGSFIADAGNQASIKFKRFLTDPSLGWLRTSAAIGLGIGSISFPIPGFLRIFMGFGGLGLGVVQIGHSPKAISASFDFLNRLSMPSSRGNGSPFGALMGMGKNKMAGGLIAAIVAIPLSLILFTFNGISNSQSTFLPQAVSPINVVPDSKYISVTKTADPSVFPGEPPLQVKYTVAITAKEGNLTNIQVSEKFTSFTSKGNPSITSPTLPAIPSTLEEGKTHTITFAINLGKEFKDSVVTNTITVTADVESGPVKESTTRSVSVIIGNPPTFCFTFTGNWTEGDKGMIMESIGKISKSTAYSSFLCSGGPVFIQRGGDMDYGGEVTDGNTITMYNRAFRNKPSLFYTFAHETGHVYGHRNGTSYNAFSISTHDEPFLPTYTLKQTLDEDFAETIAVYIVRKEVPNLSGVDIINMEAKWPKHYNFAKTNIFSDFDGF
ncbi:MAG: hypothetical protein UT38_C0003G0023 [Microgenomates group bacterium GW2011_GWA2_39_19]|nr:MAG: hypothetical protein UT38_C0003G0023 [Microgenomates group bacterium GW2011_GWA2_39_19]HBL52192.1 hypothetical protein [Candidatus Blackburnbacteria bacterium]